MYRIILMVLIVGLLAFWLYPEQNSISAEEDAYKLHQTKATSKVQMQAERKSVIEPISNKDFGVENTQRNANEAVELATELRLCKSIPKSDSELSLWLDNANSVGEPIEFIEDVIARYERCSKHAVEEQSYITLLLKAAEQGSDEAVSTLWAIGEQEYFESFDAMPLSWEALIAERLAFTQKKYDLAHKVALQGGEKSLERLVKGYQHFDPATNGQSYYKAVAYANFAIATTRNNDLYRQVDWIKQRLLNSMSDDELEQAQSLTEKLLAEAMNGQN